MTCSGLVLGDVGKKFTCTNCDMSISVEKGTTTNFAITPPQKGANIVHHIALVTCLAPSRTTIRNVVLYNFSAPIGTINEQSLKLH